MDETASIAAFGDGRAALLRLRVTLAAVTKLASISMAESAKATPGMWTDAAGAIEIEITATNGRPTSACRDTMSDLRIKALS